MRLNPSKCAFGVKSGKFMGYMITHWGIEVNLKKVQAVMDMQAPTSVKEMQRLTGRLTALGHFLSKFVEQSCNAQKFCDILVNDYFGGNIKFHEN